MASNSSRNGKDGVVVIGLGRFGISLALELIEQGTEVLGVDRDEQLIASMAGRLTHAVQADATDEEAMRQLSVDEFDRVVIGVGTNLESSILTAQVVMTLGVRHVWAKAVSQPHARILTSLGVRHVVRPEHDTGRRVAHLVRGRMLDYIEFDDGYALVKTTPPSRIVDTALGRTGVRSRYGVTVVGVKSPGKGFTHATQETVVDRGDLIIVSGPREKVERFCELG